MKKESATVLRSKMLKAYMDKGYSDDSFHPIALLFKSCEEDKKEALASKITKIIEESRSRAELLELVKTIQI